MSSTHTTYSDCMRYLEKKYGMVFNSMLEFCDNEFDNSTQPGDKDL